MLTQAVKVIWGQPVASIAAARVGPYIVVAVLSTTICVPCTLINICNGSVYKINV